jgi:hypothetical protein
METKNSRTLRDAKKFGEKIIDEASPRAREAIEQITDIADDIYGKASDWLSEGNNRNYSLVVLAASAGILGFILGRGVKRDAGRRMERTL